ncbi:hypothetical protein [Aurantibacillus circumpalustris]|uniref:hypothetical protein n=1 Tax=Aurantibacillus circumpalustris TaxID=3036359 RepID=UPI00295C3007|nr:hypothetical protein [Aurantibacillus circumpalustris]
MKKIKTFEDALKALKLGFTPPEGLSKDELAYMKLKIIAQALNDGWKPNWNNWDEWKYYPWFRMGDDGGSPGVGFSDNDYGLVYSNSTVGSRLCFKSSELAEYAGKQFEELYKDYYLID